MKIGLLCFHVNYVSCSCDGGGNKSYFVLSTPCASGTTLSSLQHSGLVLTTALGGRCSFQVRKHRWVTCQPVKKLGLEPSTFDPAKLVCSASCVLSPPWQVRLGLGEGLWKEVLTGLCQLSSLLERMSHFITVDTTSKQQMVNFFCWQSDLWTLASWRVGVLWSA